MEQADPNTKLIDHFKEETAGSYQGSCERWQSTLTWFADTWMNAACF